MKLDVPLPDCHPVWGVKLDVPLSDSHQEKRRLWTARKRALAGQGVQKGSFFVESVRSFSLPFALLKLLRGRGQVVNADDSGRYRSLDRDDAAGLEGLASREDELG